MKLTKETLKKIIKEELEATLNEMEGGDAENRMNKARAQMQNLKNNQSKMSDVEFRQQFKAAKEEYFAAKKIVDQQIDADFEEATEEQF